MILSTKCRGEIPGVDIFQKDFYDSTAYICRDIHLKTTRPYAARALKTTGSSKLNPKALL
jgi:hypothetical protein